MAPSKSRSSLRKVAERSDRESSLPHDGDREQRQPYAREVEDYKHGVAAPPGEQVGKKANPEPPRERSDK